MFLYFLTSINTDIFILNTGSTISGTHISNKNTNSRVTMRGNEIVRFTENKIQT